MTKKFLSLVAVFAVGLALGRYSRESRTTAVRSSPATEHSAPLDFGSDVTVFEGSPYTGLTVRRYRPYSTRINGHHTANGSAPDDLSRVRTFRIAGGRVEISSVEITGDH